MKSYYNRRVVGRHKSRAATMIEFALVFPIFLFMMLFSVDMGLLMLSSGAMNDNAFAAARAGAQVGGAGYESFNSSPVCGSNGTCPGGNAYETAIEGYDSMPLGEGVASFDPSQFNIVSGAQCINGTPDSYVTVQMPWKFQTFTPGLGDMLGIVMGDGSGDFTLTATGVAKCEVYRRS